MADLSRKERIPKRNTKNTRGIHEGKYERIKSQRVMIATEDGGYEFASDYDEETLALITREEHGILKMLTGMNV